MPLRSWDIKHLLMLLGACIILTIITVSYNYGLITGEGKSLKQILRHDWLAAKRSEVASSVPTSKEKIRLSDSTGHKGRTEEHNLSFQTTTATVALKDAPTTSTGSEIKTTDYSERPSGEDAVGPLMPKPTVTKSLLAQRATILPSEIIDLDKEYPDIPPDVTWPDDVIITWPEFDKTKPVPRVLHLAWYGGKKRGNVLKLHHYISFLSAYKRLKPKRILFWYDERPTGEWWTLISQLTRKVLQMVQRNPPTKIFDRPIEVPEHHSDVVRLEAVIYYGGVYIDLDVIVLKDFEPLYAYDTTMGYEVSYGLCNGIIVSKPAAPFLNIWYDRYRTFDDKQWAEHSVILPAQLAKENPHLIHTEENTMHKPSWSELSKIYDDGVPYDWSNNYSIHLWYRLHGTEHTMDEIRTMDTTYGQISRYTLYDSPKLLEPKL